MEDSHVFGPIFDIPFKKNHRGFVEVRVFLHGVVVVV